MFATIANIFLFHNNLFVDQLLLDQVALGIETEMLRVHSKFHVDHGPAGPVLFKGKDHPVPVAVTLIRVKGNVIFGEDVEFVVHEDGDVALIIKGGAAPQMV